MKVVGFQFVRNEPSFIESNILDQMEQLLNNNVNTSYVSMSANAYNILASEFGEQPRVYNGMPIIVNPYQEADVVVLSDCVTEAQERGWLQ
jgi:uncharacterized lipoprotein YddW (UPF0748 family)